MSLIPVGKFYDEDYDPLSLDTYYPILEELLDYRKLPFSRDPERLGGGPIPPRGPVRPGSVGGVGSGGGKPPAPPRWRDLPTDPFGQNSPGPFPDQPTIGYGRAETPSLGGTNIRWMKDNPEVLRTILDHYPTWMEWPRRRPLSDYLWDQRN